MMIVKIYDGVNDDVKIYDDVLKFFRCPWKHLQWCNKNKQSFTENLRWCKNLDWCKSLM